MMNGPVYYIFNHDKDAAILRGRLWEAASSHNAKRTASWLNLPDLDRAHACYVNRYGNGIIYTFRSP